MAVPQSTNDQGTCCTSTFVTPAHSRLAARVAASRFVDSATSCAATARSTWASHPERFEISHESIDDERRRRLTMRNVSNLRQSAAPAAAPDRRHLYLWASCLYVGAGVAFATGTAKVSHHTSTVQDPRAISTVAGTS